MNENNFSNSANSFEESVASFSHECVKGNPDHEKRHMLPSLIIRSVLIGLFIGLFGYAVFMLASNAFQTEEVTELYDSVRAENLISAIKPDAPMLEPSPLLTLKELVDSNSEYHNYVGEIDSIDDITRRSSYYRNYVNFKKKYEDAFAWIRVDYTEIDYPVMKGEETEYYLFHDINGKKSSSGSIVAESDLADEYGANMNAVIYGHCMKNGTMFRTIKTFLESANKNTLSKTMQIEIYTDEGLYVYSVLSAYREDGAHFAKTYFPDAESYETFLNKIVSKNTLRVSNKYAPNSKVCTLITCANVTSNEEERYVLHGVLTSFIPASQL